MKASLQLKHFTAASADRRTWLLKSSSALRGGRGQVWRQSSDTGTWRQEEPGRSWASGAGVKLGVLALPPTQNGLFREKGPGLDTWAVSSLCRSPDCVWHRTALGVSSAALPPLPTLTGAAQVTPLNLRASLIACEVYFSPSLYLGPSMSFYRHWTCNFETQPAE